MQAHPSWRVYVGDDIATSGANDIVTAAPSHQTNDPSRISEEATARLLDTAFARRAHYTLQTLPSSIRQQPSAAPSPVLRWLLLHSAGKHENRGEVGGTTPGATVQQSPAVPPAESPAAQGAPLRVSTAATAAASGLARRGVGPKDPLLQRLMKKHQKAASSASASTSITPAPSSDGANRAVSQKAIDGASAHAPAASHWTQRPWSAMTSTSWKVFRQQLGITIELVAPTRLTAEMSNPTAEQSSSLPKTLPPVDMLPAIRCWEEAQLPLSLGLCVTHAYALPTAVQAQCVPLALLPRPVPPVSSANDGNEPDAAAATALGMDILAVAETGSGKTAAYLVPLLYHVLCRAPKLLGYPDRISLGPLSLVMVPTRELAEQVTASLLQLCGQSRVFSASNNNKGKGQISLEALGGWEADEVAVTSTGDLNPRTSAAAALAARNHLSEMRVVKVVGGESRDAQYHALAQGAHCVVGTVGQLHTLLEDRLLSLGNAQYVVMDEADRMIDEQQEERLVSVLGRCPQPRQTVMFTATLSAACAAVAKRYLARSGYYVVRTPYRCASIRQSFELVADIGAPATDAAGGAPTPAAVDAQSHRAPRQQVHAAGNGNSQAQQQQQQQQQRQRRLHPAIHAQKFSRLVAWLVYGTAPIIIFANEKATCDVLWEELRAEAEHLDAQQEYYTIEDIVGAPPDGLSFRENIAGCQGDASSATSSAAARHTPSLINLTSVATVHSELSQSERRSLVAQFQRRQRHVLITTDLLARGLDVASVTLVINYDVPWAASASPSDALTQYIHRIGRTGRAGSTGAAVTFVTLPAAMVQRAEELVARGVEAEAAPKQTEGQRKVRSAAAREEGDVDDDLAAIGELFDGDTHNVWMTAAISSASTAPGSTDASRRRSRHHGGDDNDSDSDDGGDDVDRDDSDSSVGDSNGDTPGIARRDGNSSRKPSRKRRKRSAPAFANDAAALRPLWSFLVECAEGEGCRDGAAALRRGTYAKISVPPALGCIMAQLSATSQYGRITL